MGFFGSQTLAKAAGGESLDELYHKQECKACPLNRVDHLQNPKMKPTGAKKPDIYILGEAPGADEDEENEQFVGRSGQLLRRKIPKEWRDRVRFSNVIRCHPDENRNPEPIEIECCRPFNERDIEAAEPKAIFGFGNYPLNWMLKQSGIIKWRGRRIPVRIGSHACWFYPMLDPAFVVRSQRRVGESKDEHVFRLDLDRAFGEVDNLPSPPFHDRKMAFTGLVAIDWRDPRASQEVAAFLDKAAQEPESGLDFETNKLRPYYPDSKILSVSVSINGKSVSFPYDHPECQWSKPGKELIRQAFLRYLKAPVCKVVQNLAYEMEWIAVKFGREYIRGTKWADTMVQAYTLDERVGGKPDSTKPSNDTSCMGLGFLTLHRFGINIKSLSDVNTKDMESEPLEKILPYNAMDAKYCLELFYLQRELLKADGTEKVYTRRMRRIPTLVLTQFRGVPIDFDQADKQYKTLEGKISAAEKAIAVDSHVAKFETKYKKKFKPGSDPDCVKLFRDIIGSKAGEEKDYDGKVIGYSVNKTSLSKIKEPIAKKVLQWREPQKLFSTYTWLRNHKYVYPDGKLHPIFNGFFTSTGRNCLAGDTILETDLGECAISELDLLGTFRNAKIRTHRNRWRRITNLWFKGYERMVRLSFSNGRCIECTAGHKLLKGFNWVEVGSCRLGDRVAADTSFQKRSERTGTKKVVSYYTQKQPEYENTGREVVCSFELTLLPSPEEICGTNRVGDESNERFSEMVWPLLRVGHETFLESKQFDSSNGKQTRTAQSKSYFEQSSVIGVSRGRLAVREYRQEDEYDAFLCKEEYRVSQASRTRYKTNSFYAFHEAGLCTDQCRCSWNNNVACAERVQTEAFGGGSSFVPRLPKVIDVCRSNKDGYVETRKSPPVRGSILVEKSGGTFYCGGISLSGNTPLSPVVAGILPQPTDGGFLFGQGEGGYRSGWSASFSKYEVRREERTVFTKAGVSYISNYRRSGPQAWEGNGSEDTISVEITKIEDAGIQAVWDITVDEDHSYVAQGVVHHNSSEDPNGQNLPVRTKEGKETRKQIKAPDGHLIFKIDYGQIEARCIAMESKDKVFVQALWENYDVHMEWAERLAKAEPRILDPFRDAEKPMKELRQRMKSGWVFALFFGSQQRSVEQSFGFDEGTFTKEFNQFWKIFSGVKDWQEELKKDFKERGYVENALGIRRRAPISSNQLINAPIQNLASEIVMDGMNALSEKDDLYYQPILNIHDDLTSIFPADKFDDYVEEEISTLLSAEYPFLNVPLVVEASFGKNLCDVEKIGDFASNTWFK